MEDHPTTQTTTTNASAKPARIPWNKGKLVGAKPPLRPSHVWSIRTKLQIEGKKRDLALFNLAIDSKLRGCDVVAVRVDDVAPSGYSMDRATIRQKKTGRPVRFELTDQTRMAIDDYLRLTGRKPGQFLFAGRGDRAGLTTRQYARLVQEWVASIGKRCAAPTLPAWLQVGDGRAWGRIDTSILTTIVTSLLLPDRGEQKSCLAPSGGGSGPTTSRSRS